MGRGEGSSERGLERRLRQAVTSSPHEASELLRIIALSPDGFSRKEFASKHDAIRPLVRDILDTHRSYYFCEDATPNDIATLAAAHEYIYAETKDAQATITSIEASIKAASAYLAIHSDHDLTGDSPDPELMQGPDHPAFERYYDFQRVRILRGRLYHELYTQHILFDKTEQAKLALNAALSDLESATGGLIPPDQLLPATLALSRAYIDSGNDEGALGVLLRLKLHRDPDEQPGTDAEEEEARKTLETLISRNPDSEFSVASKVHDVMQTGLELENIKDARKRAGQLRELTTTVEDIYRANPDNLLVVWALGMTYFRTANATLESKNLELSKSYYDRAITVYSSIIRSLEAHRPPENDPTDEEDEEDAAYEPREPAESSDGPPPSPISLSEAHMMRGECYRQLAEAAKLGNPGTQDIHEHLELSREDFRKVISDPWVEDGPFYDASWNLAEYEYLHGNDSLALDHYLTLLQVTKRSPPDLRPLFKRNVRAIKRRIKSLLNATDCIPDGNELDAYVTTTAHDILSDAHIGLN